MEREDPSSDADDAEETPHDTETSEWRFAADEFESDVEREARSEREAERARDETVQRVEMHEDHEGERRGSVAGGNDRGLPVEPESVNLENALFVLLGIVVTLAVFAQFVVG